MKFFSVISLIFLFFISCDNSSKEIKNIENSIKIEIPPIKKDSDDANFQLKNGVLNYADEPYSGIVYQYYQDKTLKSIATYYQGKKEGKYLGYYPNQKKWFERYYAKGIKIKTHKSWYQNGQQMFEYQFNNQGVYDGFVKDWHSNGQLARYFNFKNGKENGSQKMWKPTGKIRANFFTVDGERHGLIGLKNCISVAKTE